jgi:adenosylhomocysteine nucleosidase
VIIVVGMAFEARIAAGAGVSVICSGDGRNLAEALTRTIADACAGPNGCRGIVSFGVAGGLAPGLKPGTCVVGSAILSDTLSLTTDVDWSRKLLLALPEAVHGPILGVGAPVAHPDAKRALYVKTGAVAVDMESHVVALASAEFGVPMVAIRVITDPALRALPQSAVAAIRANGTTDIAAMLRSVMRRPRDLPDLVQTALDAWAARAMLLRGRRVLSRALVDSDSSGLSST